MLTPFSMPKCSAMFQMKVCITQLGVYIAAVRPLLSRAVVGNGKILAAVNGTRELADAIRRRSTEITQSN